jgi:hypothetical protein
VPEKSGFIEIDIRTAVDTFGGAAGESKVRLFEVYACPFFARRLN